MFADNVSSRPKNAIEMPSTLRPSYNNKDMVIYNTHFLFNVQLKGTLVVVAAQVHVARIIGLPNCMVRPSARFLSLNDFFAAKYLSASARCIDVTWGNAGTDFLNNPKLLDSHGYQKRDNAHYKI